MKRTALILAVLLLCAAMLSSCDGIKEQQSVDQLDKLEQQFEQKGYECSRWKDTGNASYAESLVSASGVLLKGGITGMMEYMYTDESAGKHVYGVVIGTTCKDDSEKVGEVYVASIENVVKTVECTAYPLYVQIEYTLS